MRLIVGWMLCLLLLAGCEPGVSRDELGTLLEEVPDFPVANQSQKAPASEPVSETKHEADPSATDGSGPDRPVPAETE